jgi:hypothetical protein
MPVQIAAGRIDGVTGAAAALRALDEVRAEAVRRGLARYEFDARRAMVEIEQRTASSTAKADLAALQKDARARGYGLYAR